MVANFQKLAPDFAWPAYFDTIGIGNFGTLNVATPDFFKGLNSLFESEPLEAWKSYLRWHVLHGQAQDLSKAFFDENFNFFSKTLGGQKEPCRAGGSAPSLPTGRWARPSARTG
jgi:putative endopeptidase